MDKKPFVRFAVVPFLPASQPALGISSLISVLHREGFGAGASYLNLSYGDEIGWDLYQTVTNRINGAFLPGELIFTKALWGEDAPAFEAYDARIRKWFDAMSERNPTAAKLPLFEWWEHNTPAMRRAIDEAPRFIDQWADELLADSPRIIGFTSTFQQAIAGLALAKEIRRRVPKEEVALIFGGANCEADMGQALAENFDCIDCVVSGEGELVLLDVVRRLCGLAEDDAPAPRFVQGRIVKDMDALPLPSFEDFFAASEETSLDRAPYLAVESSRGCWWGVKSHCTFCGLNGGGLTFRSKSPERFNSELQELSAQYESRLFAVTDNILDMGYLKSLVPNLVQNAQDYNLFYETKANLKKDQVELMAAAGIASLQPGIESLSTEVLRLMGKGTTMMQNVQLLKWCAEFGVKVMWNLLYGFPKEPFEAYERMAELLPGLYHLTPPLGCGKIRLDRFGPYWTNPGNYGLSNVRHYWSYDFAYSGLPPEQRSRLAYFFEYDYDDGRNPYDYACDLVMSFSRWREAKIGGAKLEFRFSATSLSVVDTRPCAVEEEYPLSMPEARLLLALDGHRNVGSLTDRLQKQGIDLDESAIRSLLEEMKRRFFVIEEKGVWLSLIVNPTERKRVADRKVALRAKGLGFSWPDDFPDPQRRQLVRAAMLAMAPNDSAPSP